MLYYIYSCQQLCQPLHQIINHMFILFYLGILHPHGTPILHAFCINVCINDCIRQNRLLTSKTIVQIFSLIHQKVASLSAIFYWPESSTLLVILVTVNGNDDFSRNLDHSNTKHKNTFLKKKKFSCLYSLFFTEICMQETKEKESMIICIDMENEIMVETSTKIIDSLTCGHGK